MLPTINELKAVMEQVIANDIHMDVKYLRKMWSLPYDPQHHLFTKDKNGNKTSIWLLDIDTWKMIGDAYCRWMLIESPQTELFWQSILAIIQQTPEWETAGQEYKIWLFNRAFPYILRG